MIKDLRFSSHFSWILSDNQSKILASFLSTHEQIKEWNFWFWTYWYGEWVMSPCKGNWDEIVLTSVGRKDKTSSELLSSRGSDSSRLEAPTHDEVFLRAPRHHLPLPHRPVHETIWQPISNKWQGKKKT